MAHEIVTKPAFSAIGYSWKGSDAKEIGELWDRFVPALHSAFPPESIPEALGISRNWNEATQTFEYLAGVEVPQGTTLPDGMETWHLRSATYAVFDSTLPSIHADIQAACQEVACVGPIIEVYGQDFNPEAGKFGLKLYVTVSS